MIDRDEYAVRVMDLPVSVGGFVTLPEVTENNFQKNITYYVILMSRATKNFSDIADFVKKILRLCSG